MICFSKGEHVASKPQKQAIKRPFGRGPTIVSLGDNKDHPGNWPRIQVLGWSSKYLPLDPHEKWRF